MTLLERLHWLISRCSATAPPTGAPAHDDLTDGQALALLRAGSTLEWYRFPHRRVLVNGAVYAVSRAQFHRLTAHPCVVQTPTSSMFMLQFAWRERAR
jgi:hypothetical protein